jgi:hypothetical protein
MDSREITIDQIREMVRRDGHMRALLRVLALPLRSAPVTFIPSEGDGSATGEEEAEFVESSLTRPVHAGGMSRSLDRTFAAMAWALADGYAVFEKVWQVTPEGQFTYRKFAPRAAKTCRFILDDSGGLVGVRQRVTWQGKSIDVVIPAEKLLVYTAQDEANPWYGESYFLPAWYHYDWKQKLYYLAHLAYQFRAVPGRMGSVPPQADTRQVMDFRRALANIGANAAMTKPASPEGSNAWAVDFFGQEGTMPDFPAMINHHNAEAAKSVLAQFLMLGTGSSSGSWALSSDQSDLLLIALETILDEWAETFNFYAIPQLVDYNYGTGAYPIMQIGPLADHTRELMTEVFKELCDAASTQVTPEFMFKLEERVAAEIGLEIDYEPLELRMKAEQEMQAKAQEAALKALAEGQMQPPNQQQESGDGADGAADQRQPSGVAASEIGAIADAMGKKQRPRKRVARVGTD